MTRDQKIAKARRLAADHSRSEVARRLGVAQSTVSRWLNPESAKCWAAASNVRHAAAKRAWENEHDRGVCPCGASMGVGVQRCGGRVCKDCQLEQLRVERAWRMQQVYELWHSGASGASIAAALGVAEGTVHAHVFEMRREGWDMPYRRKVSHSGSRALSAA